MSQGANSAAAAQALRRDTISGRVALPGGAAAPGMPVRVLARRLRGETALGATVTDARGFYRIEYPVPDGPADLVVRAGAEAADGRSAEAAVTGAGAGRRADLTLPGAAPTEYERLLAAVTPLLDGVALDRIGADGRAADYSYLARSAGQDLEQVSALAEAAHFAQLTGLPAESLYGVLRAGMPADLAALSRRPDSEIRKRLAEAAGRGVIAPVTAEAATGFATGLSAYAAKTDLEPADATRSPIAEILAAVIPDFAVRSRVYGALLDSGPDSDAFWAQLAEDAQAAPYASRLRLALELNTLTGGADPGLARTLLAKFDGGELVHPRDLVRLGGELPDEVRARVAEAYLSADVAHRLSADPAHADDPGTRFLVGHPEFDLLVTPVNSVSVPDSAARAELAEIQRLLRIAPGFEAMRALREQGFGSAHAVASIGPEAFARRVGPQVGADEAKAIHARALRAHAAAAHLVTDVRSAGHFDAPWLVKPQVDTTQVPDWAELFGSTDYADAPDCMTAYSESAYLVDLLSYLKRLGASATPVPGGTTEGPVADAFYARRPDILDLQLSCDNTGLTLPYVDLVIEQLESAVAPATAVPPAQLQSSGDSTQLSVQPQHVNPGAYEKLRDAVYPWDLPFDLWGEQTRAYLGGLGVGRVEMLSTIGVVPSSATTLTEERLGLTAVAAMIIAGQALTPARTLAEFYGQPARTADSTLVSDLSSVDTMLAVTGMQFADLLGVLDTRFINPTGAMSISFYPGTPRISDLTISSLNADSLERMHRFVRLQRALGWTAPELDRVIAASNNGGVLDTVTLSCVSAVRDLATRLGLAVDDVLCFFGPLGTHVYATDSALPQYDRLFLDPSVVTVPPGAVSPFALTGDRGELSVIGSLTDQAAAVALLGVLQITDAEYAELTASPRAVVPDELLNLANLSALVRSVTLARALGLSIADYLRLVELAGAQGPFASPLVASLAAEGGQPDLATGTPMAPPAHPPFPAGNGVGAPDLSGGLPMRPAVGPADPAPPTAATDALAAAIEGFISAAQAIAAAGFTVADLDLVLADNVPAQGEPGYDDSSLAIVLTGLRAAIQAVYRQTSQVTDEKGDVTGKDLALLGWDSALVQQAVATLLGTMSYTAPLTVLPGGISFPTDIAIRYEAVDPSTARLVVVGPLTNDQFGRLKALSADAAYQAAIQSLYDQPRTFVTTRMKNLRILVYTAPLVAWPADVVLPAALTGKVFFDASRSALCTRGFLSADELAALTTSSADADFRAAVTDLGLAQQAPPAPGDAFLTASDASAMFDTAVAPADRFHRVLLIIAPYLRRTLSETAVKQQLGQAAGLDAASADLLLGGTLHSPFRQTALEDFLAPEYVGSDTSVALTRTGFPEQFTMLTLLYRVALLLNRLRIRSTDLPFVAGYAPNRWLDINAMPTAPVSGPSPLFEGFVALLALVRLRNAIPGGTGSLAAVFATATAAGATEYQVVAELGTRTGWNQDDLSFLTTIVPLGGVPDFASVDTLATLNASVGILRRLGVSARRAAMWLAPQLTQDGAQAAWLAAKARYSLTDWPGVAAPMQNALRARQRDSLVSFLIANPFTDSAGAAQWKDSNGLHDYFLLDVEMGSNQQTTRLAQAIYSVQLYVQRCLLNLEPSVATADPALWAQWDWMKQYQVWVAAQKIFLYPENYFQPDLRSDPTPLFTDFVNELKQRETSADSAETGVRHYLESLDEVSRLHPCGFYHDNLLFDANGKPYEQAVYFFARTETSPRTYYFRTWQYRSSWTPWQKVDLDIESDTILPIVQNGQLYVFWPTFTQKSDEPSITMPAAGGVLQDTFKYYDIQINWSRYVNGRWSAKRVSAEPISCLNVETDQGDMRHELNFLQKFYFVATPVGDPFGLQLTCYYEWTFFNSSGTQGGYRGHATLNTARDELTVDGMTFTPYTAQQSGYPIPSPIGAEEEGNEFVQYDPYALYPSARVLTTDPLSPLGAAYEVLGSSQAGHPYRILYPNNWNGDAWEWYVLIFADDLRSYIIWPSVYETQQGTDATSVRFLTYYHPQVGTLRGQLEQGGIDALYSRDLQLNPDNYSVEKFDFDQYDWQSTGNYVGARPGPGQPVVFDAADSYGAYNWELFFHVPLLAAQRLSDNQNFADAQRWLHLIFDPTDRSTDLVPQRFWRTKPFYQTDNQYFWESPYWVLSTLAEGTFDVATFDAWLADPFQPDAVAQYRTTAYQKATVMKYLDNLLAWGDQLFRQDTLESINAATQLYVLASELLGPRPEAVTLPSPAPQTYRQLESVQPVPAPAATVAVAGAAARTVERAVVAAENLRPGRVPDTGHAAVPAVVPGLGVNWLEYFTLPRNDKLLGYWDTVADRLFKVRNGLTLDGSANQPSLFGPPIDPNLLVRATAAGLDLASVLDDISTPLPYYRYSTMSAKARELIGEVKSFGAALLAALEKRDAEALARLRSGHEMSVLTAERDVRVQQVNDAQYAVAALQQSQQIANEKELYYKSRKFMNDGETTHSLLAADALRQQEIAQMIDMAASMMGYLPDFKIGSPTTTGATLGSTNIIAALRGMSGATATSASMANAQGSMAATLGGYERRADDWGFQGQQAGAEVIQYDSQIAAALIRQQIAAKELDEHDLRIANAKEENDFLYGKYSSEELYDWMVGQLSTTYFQAYQLAYDVAKRTERAYRNELGLDDSSFIQFGYWDSLHSGLLAGERLAGDLGRMDASYLELNAREFELTKRISLAQIDPEALLRLKETGTCFLTLPEALFDLDVPGHYMRRLKSVAVSVPCVAGPYSAVNLTLSLLSSTIRADSTLSDGRYARQPGDSRFRDFTGPVQSIVTSTGLEDSGLFETSLRDERYLPFEGLGAVGEWRLTLPATLRQFDYESITDVVLHVRYTARDGGGTLAAPAVSELTTSLNRWIHGAGGTALFRGFSARREFADQWYRFLNPAAGADPALTFTLAKNRFPYSFLDQGIAAAKPDAVLVFSTDLTPDGTRRYLDAYAAGQPLPATLAGPGGGTAGSTLAADPSIGGQARGAFGTVTARIEDAGQDWTVTVPRAQVAALDPALLTADGTFNPDAVVDMLLIWNYTLATQAGQ